VWDVTACLDLKITISRFLQALDVPVEAEDRQRKQVVGRFPLHPQFHSFLLHSESSTPAPQTSIVNFQGT